MSRVSMFMHKFLILSTFIFMFFVCTDSVLCSESTKIFKMASSEDSGVEETVEQEDPWADEGSDKDVSSDDDSWEDEWKDSDEKTDASEDVWGEEEAQDGEEEQGQFKLSGKVWNKLAWDFDEDDVTNHSQVKAGTSFVPGEGMHAVLFVDVHYFSYVDDGDRDDDFTVRLDDAYLNRRGENYNVRVGNQITRWGKTDAYSPLDNLNPEDLRDNLSGRREDRKLPIPMANLEIYTDNVTIQGVYIPFFEEPEYPLKGNNLEGLRVIEEDPSKSLKNSEGGIRLSGITGKLDWAVSWLYAREDLPTPDSLVVPTGFPLSNVDLTISNLENFINATGQTIYLTHDRQNVFGFEFETTLHTFGVRGDVAYIDNASYFTRDLKRIRKPKFQTMAGIDYSGENNWYANLQFFYSHINGYDDKIMWAIETAKAFNGTLSKEFSNGDLEVECRFYYDLSGDATILNPKVRLSFWEPIILEIGGEWFDGTDETIPGQFDDYDQIYTTVEIKF